jgi:hypothetical protein
MPSGWRWAVLPKRLLDDDDRSLSLSLAERGLLFSCYLICDKNGRFPASGRAFCRLAAVNGDGLAILDKLHGLGLVTLYDVGQASYGELERYAEDRPAEMGRKSKDERYPAPHPDAARTPTARYGPDGAPTCSGTNPDGIRTESGIDETR